MAMLKGMSRIRYLYWLGAILGFEWIAMLLTQSWFEEIDRGGFVLARFVAITIGHIALFWVVRQRLARLEWPTWTAYLCVIALTFTPSSLLLMKQVFDIPVFLEKGHFWLGIPILSATIVLTVSLLIARAGSGSYSQHTLSD